MSIDTLSDDILNAWAESAYPSDDITEEQWDAYIVAQFNEQEQDRFAAQPESEV